jgi:putative phosphoesterase
VEIGILSDTHNNLKNLQKALTLFQARGVRVLIHCGDLTGMEVARAMAAFQVICVLGNGDIASGEIRDTLLAQNPDNYVGLEYTGRLGGGRLGGVRIAAAHGHLPGVVDELTHSGQYDYVFKGHSHRHQDERIGFTRLINPGALGGLRREPRQICSLDLDSGKAEFIPVEDTP